MDGPYVGGVRRSPVRRPVSVTYAFKAERGPLRAQRIRIFPRRISLVAARSLKTRKRGLTSWSWSAIAAQSKQPLMCRDGSAELEWAFSVRESSALTGGDFQGTGSCELMTVLAVARLVRRTMAPCLHCRGDRTDPDACDSAAITPPGAASRR